MAYRAVPKRKDAPLRDVYGAGGGGGKAGGGGGASTAPDTLFSSSTVNLIGLISEGETGDVVGGLKGVYRNSTPVQNQDGTFNFKGITAEFRVGTPDQAYMEGFPGVQTEQPVGVVIRQSTPVVATLSDPSFDRVRVTVAVGALFMQKTDGSMRNNVVDYRIEIQYYNGPWISQGNFQIIGKTSSGYYRQHEFALPKNPSGAAAPWNIRVTRITPDDDRAADVQQKFTVQSTMTFYSITGLIDTKFSYPHSALIGLSATTSQLGDNVGEIRVLTDGIKMMVPSNRTVNAGTNERTYSGVWDGTFKEEVADSPIWLLNHLVINDRFGLGQYVDEAGIDRITFYEIGRYCDQLVSDGAGGLEPRYTFNGEINTQQEAYDLLQLVAQVYRGMVYWSSGSITSTQDRPGDIKMLVTESNVLEGKLEYSSSSRKARHTVAMVSWHDPKNLYRENIEFVENSEGIALYGYNPVRIDLLGCTSRGQAHRAGLWTLYTELYETQVLSYRAGLDHALLRPGELIAVQDPQISNLDLSGRLRGSTSTTTLYLDHAITLNAGVTYKVSVVLPDGTVQERAIQSSTTGGDGRTVLTLASPLSSTPVKEAVWHIAGNIVPQKFRVVSIKEDEPHIYSVVALEHEPSKFAAIDDGAAFEETPFSDFPNVVAAPVNLQARSALYMENLVPRQSITLSWQPGSVFNSVGYYVTIIMPSGDIVNRPRTASTSLDILDAESGPYRFVVVAVGLDGHTSLPTELTYTLGGWSAEGAAAVKDLQVLGGGSVFSGRSATLTWRNAFDDGRQIFPLRNVVRVFDADSQNMLHVEVLPLGQTTWTYDYNVNVNEGGPRRRFRVAVSALGPDNSEGLQSSLVVNNPAPGIIVPTANSNSETLFIELPSVADNDHVGYLVWISETSGFNPLTTPFIDTTDNFYNTKAQNGKTYYIRAAAYDAFGKSPADLAISAEISRRVTLEIFDALPPPIPGQPTLTSNVAEVAPDGTVTSKVTFSWPAVVSENLGTYELAFAEGNNPPESAYRITTRVSTPVASYAGLMPGRQYTFKVRSTPRNGFDSSGWSPVLVVTAALNTTAPNAPTNLLVTPSFEAANLAWTNPTNKDLLGIEVWAGTTNVLANAALLKVVPYPGAFYRDVLGTTATKFYWIRAVNTSDVKSGYTGPQSVTSIAITAGQLQAGIIDATKLASSLAANTVVTTLPTTRTTAYVTLDGEQYRWDATAGRYTKAVPATDISGKILAAQIDTVNEASIRAALAASSIATSQLTGNLEAARIAGQITDAQIASGLSASKVSGALANASLATSALTGQIVDNQISSGVSAAKITGDLTNATLAAGKLSGQIADAQIADGLSAAKVSGSLTAATLPTARLSGTIVDAQIAAGVSAAKVSGALTAATLAAGAITGQISDAQIAAGLSAAKITTGLMSGDRISSLIGSKITGAITLATLDTGRLTGTIGADLIAANSILASKLVLTDLQNLCLNPNFSQGITEDWRRSSSAAVTLSNAASGDLPAGAPALNAAKMVRVTDDVWLQNVASNGVGAIPGAPCLGGETFYIEAMVYCDVATQVSTQPIGYNLAGIAVGSTQLFVNIPAGVWTKLSGTIPMSAAAVGATFRIRPQVNNTTIWVTNLRFLRRNAAELIVDGTIIANHLATDSVTTRALQAGSVVSATIAANAIVASHLAVSSTNLATNGDLSQGRIGWAGSATPDTDTLATGPEGLPSFRVAVASMANGASHSIAVRNVVQGGTGGDLFPVVGGQWYEASGYPVTSPGFRAQAQILFYNASNTLVGSPLGANIVPPTNNDGTLRTATRAFVIAQAPAGAVTAYIRVLYTATAALTSPVIRLSGMMFANAVAGQTEPSPYVTPGVTQINGANLITRTINAQAIAVGGVIAENIAANAVTASKMVLIDSQNLCLNPSFQQVWEDWLRGPSASVTLSNAASGDLPAGAPALNAARLTRTTAAVYVQALTDPGGGLPRGTPCGPTDLFYGEAMVYSDVVAVVTLQAVGYTAANGLTGGSGVNVNIPAGVWTKVSATVPVSATAVGSSIRISNSTNNSNLWVTNVRFQRKNGAELIVDGTISARKLMIGGTSLSNIFTAGEFLDGLDGWNATEGATYSVIRTGDGPSGAPYVRLTRTQAASGASSIFTTSTDLIPIEGGIPHEGSFYVRGSTASPTGSYLRFSWFDANQVATTVPGTGGVVNTPSYSDIVSNGPFPAVWTRYSGTLTPPASARYFRVTIYNHLTSSTQTADIAAITLRRIIGATLIEDGAITTDKIFANAITTAKIAAGAVTAGEIAANSIVASKLAVASINLVPNGDLSQGLLGHAWSADGTPGITAATLTLEADTGPDSLSTAVTTGTGTLTASKRFLIVSRAIKQDGSFTLIPVTAGQRYEASAYISGTAGAIGYVQVVWYQPNGTTYISESNGSVLTLQDRPVGSLLSRPRSVMFATAPANAGYAAIRTIFSHTAAVASPVLRAAGIMLAPCVANQTEASPFVSPGMTLVSGGSIITRTINAQAIAVGGIIAENIAAGSVTASKMVLVDQQNLCLNPSFAQGLGEDWLISSSATVSLSNATIGDLPASAPASNAVRLTRTAAAAWVQNAAVAPAGSFRGTPTAPGEQFYVEAMVYADVAAAFSFQTIGYNTAGAAAGGSAVNATVPAGVWTKLSGTVSMPANSVTGCVRLQNNTNNSSIWITNVRWQRKNGAELIVDGTISARKLMIGATAANLISAGEFLDGLDSYDKSENANFIIGRTGGPTGGNYLRLSRNGVTTSPPSVNAQTLDFTPIEGGTVYEAACYLRASASTTGLRWRLNWFDENKVATTVPGTGGAGNAATYTDVWNQLQPIASTWAQITRQITPPATARYFKFQIYNHTDGTADWLDIANVSLRKAMTATTIVDGAITTAKILAGNITTELLAAGSVTASRLAVVSANMTFNPDASQGTLGLTLGFNGTGLAVQGPDVRVGPIFYAPSGFTSFQLRIPSATASTTSSAQFHSQQASAAKVLSNYSVTGGTTYELSACLSMHRATGAVAIAWYTSAGAYISESSGSVVPSNGSNGGLYSTFPKSTLIAVAPANAASAMLIFRMQSFSGADPYMFVSAIMFAATRAGATETSPYVAPGITTIDGSVLTTGSVVARHILANQINAGHIVAGGIDAKDIIATGTITTDQLGANSVQAKNVLAGAITASKLTLADTTNALLNGHFLDRSSEGWTLYGDTNIDLANAADPGGQWRLTGTNQMIMARSTQWIQVTPGETLYLAAMVYNNRTSGNAGFYLEFYDQAGGNGFGSYSPTRAEKNTWVKAEGRVLVPDGRQKLRVCLYADAQNTGNCWFGKVQVRRANNAEMIVDGAITARTLNVDNIFATEAVINSLRTGIGTFGGLRADQIAAGAITATQLGVGLSTGNLVWNSEREVAGFLTWNNPNNFAALGEGGTDWCVSGVKNFTFFKGGSNPTDQLAYADLLYPTANGGTSGVWPVQAGQTYEWSIYLSAHRCRGYIEAHWWNGTQYSLAGYGSLVENVAGTTVPADSWRARMKMTAPADAQGVVLRVVFLTNKQNDAYMVASAPYLGLVPTGTPAATYSAYTPQSRTVISGGQIATNSINATSIKTNSITTDRLQAGQINVDTIAATESISTDKLKANVLTAASIKVQGDYRLSNWASGTQINGGAIQANSITTQTLRIDARGITPVNVYFEMERVVNADGSRGAATGVLTWTTGQIEWVDNNGNRAFSGVPAGRVARGSDGWCTVWFSTNFPNVLFSNSGNNIPAIRADPSCILVATSADLTGVIVNWGGTIIDGEKITTNSIVARNIATDAIQARHVAAGNITADKIQAGAITADKLQVGVNNGNLIQNADFRSGTQTLGAFYFGSNPINFQLLSYPNGVEWGPARSLGCAQAFAGGRPNGGVDIYINNFDIDGNQNSFFPVEGGRRYEFSAYLNCWGGTNGYARIAWYDINKQFISESYGNGILGAIHNGNFIPSQRSVNLNTSPANAAYCQLTIRVNYTGNNDNPDVYMTGLYFAQANPNQTIASPWSPSGVTVIDGGSIRARSIQADRLTATSLSAITADLGTVTAGVARSADSRFVIDFNSKYLAIWD